MVSHFIFIPTNKHVCWFVCFYFDHCLTSTFVSLFVRDKVWRHMLKKTSSQKFCFVRRNLNFQSEATGGEVIPWMWFNHVTITAPIYASKCALVKECIGVCTSTCVHVCTRKNTVTDRHDMCFLPFCVSQGKLFFFFPFFA